jgi:hypothetical protein
VVVDRGLPALVRGFSAAFVVWVAAAEFKHLPWGEDVELTYGPAEQLLSGVTPILGVVLVVVAMVESRRSTKWTAQPSAETVAVQ